MFCGRRLDNVNLKELRQSVFDFACGGRMCALWNDWGAIDANDRASVCGREDVRAHCFEWATLNAETFGEICRLIANFANRDYATAKSLWEAYKKEQAKSENASVVLSRAVNVEGLPKKQSKR